MKTLLSLRSIGLSLEIKCDPNKLQSPAGIVVMRSCEALQNIVDLRAAKRTDESWPVGEAGKAVADVLRGCAEREDWGGVRGTIADLDPPQDFAQEMRVVGRGREAVLSRQAERKGRAQKLREAGTRIQELIEQGEYKKAKLQ